MTRRSNKLSRIIKSFVFIGISIVLISIVVTTAFRVYNRNQELTQLKKEKETLLKEQEKLEEEVKLLNDDDYVIRYAREHYIFSKDGEQVATLPETKK